MSDLYQIHWTRKSDGRKGVGPKLFERDEALSVCDELNEEYGDIEHRVEPYTGRKPFDTVRPPSEASQRVAREAAEEMESLGYFDKLGNATTKIDPLTDEDPYPIDSSRYTGLPLKDVPAQQLDWIRGQPHLARKYPALAAYIESRAEAINQELERGRRER